MVKLKRKEAMAPYVLRLDKETKAFYGKKAKAMGVPETTLARAVLVEYRERNS